MTWHDVNIPVDTLDQAYTKFVNLLKIMRGQTQNQRIFQRSILPLGGILSFLFGTAYQKDLEEIRKNVKIIYENQKVLDNVTAMTDISRAMIRENRLMIKNMVDSVQFLSKTSVNIHKEIEPLFITRRFLLIHAEVLMHTHRLRIASLKLVMT